MRDLGAVQCDQCGRRFPTAAEAAPAICPSCGHGLSRSPTALAASVPLDDAVTREALPMTPKLATAAPDPDVFRSAPPITSPPADVTRDLPLSASSYGSGAGRAGGAGVSAGELATAAASAAGKSGGGKSDGGRRGPLVALSAAALVIVLLLGAGATVLLANGQIARLLAPAARATATSTTVAGPPPPPVGFTTYRDPEGAYLLWIPTSWTTNTAHAGGATLTTFSDAAHGAIFEIEVSTGGSAPDPAADVSVFLGGAGVIASQQYAGGSAGGSYVSGHTGPVTVALGGSTWTQEAEDVVVLANGHSVASLHVVALATKHNGSTLLLVEIAPASAFQAVDTADFSLMRGSLLLLAAGP